MPADRSSQHTLILTAVIGLTIAAYAPVFRAGFVDYDDYRYVGRNERVAIGVTVDNVAWAFTTRTASNWHPLTWLSYMIDAQVFGLRPQAFHVVNLALHALNAVVLYLVMWSMTAAVWRSALVAALFAVHPLHVESVAWISERKELLSTLFGLLAIGAYVRWVRRRSIALYVATAVLMASSLMAKPMWVTLPFALCCSTTGRSGGSGREGPAHESFEPRSSRSFRSWRSRPCRRRSRSGPSAAATR